MTTAKFCTVCGKLVFPDASFCAFCGARLGIHRLRVSAAATRRAKPCPDVSDLRGECAVLAADARCVSMPEVGRIVARAVARPLPDVTREMRDSRGILARGLGPAKARDLVTELEGVGARVFALDEEHFIEQPPVRRMRGAVFDEVGFRCEAYTWDATETLAASWERVFLVAGGRLEIVEVFEVEKDKSGRRMFWRMSSMAEEIDRHVPKLESRTRYESVLDLVLYDPWERLRLDENVAALALAAAPEDFRLTIQQAAASLYTIRHNAPLNPGVEYLATQAPADAWGPLTFSSKQEFDAYTLWLIQLTRYGFEMPR